jgi:hypothetical protein
VVLVDGELAGWVRPAQRPTYDWLDLIVLGERHRGNGLGRSILETLIEETCQRGTGMWLSVYRVNPACRLYTRLGFSTHERDDIRVLMGHRGGTDRLGSPPRELLLPGPNRRGEQGSEQGSEPHT